MSNDKHCDLLIDYYNGHLDAQQKEEFEKHLAGCSDCQEELAEWETLNAELVQDLEQVEPPADMEKRILTNIFDADTTTKKAETTSDEKFNDKNEKLTKSSDIKTNNKRPKPNGFSRKLLIPLAAALLLSVIGNIYLWTSQQESQTVSEALLDEGETVDLAPTSDTLDMDAKMAMHESSSSQTVVLEAQNFTSLNEGEVYQVWLMKDEKPYRAGTLVPNENGEGYTVFTLDDAENVDWDAVAITVEPSPQNQAPEGEILMLAEF